VLSTEQVRINTMQVEIKSMMVGKKQLTLSLMRQIIEEPLIDEKELLFRGVPWGHVNYFWGDDKHKTYPNYINVVWQKGDVLRRSVIEMNLHHYDHCEKRCLREIKECLEQIKYYTQYPGFDNKIAGQKALLSSLQNDLKEHEYRRDVFIPKYHELVHPLKSLDHFYITV
jgi:hypothetical protein